MSTVPLIPDTAPFSPEQRAWLNGFFAGIFSRGPSPEMSSAPSGALTPLTVLFGSQTGTAEGLAKQAAKEAGKRGFAPTVLDMASTDSAALAGSSNLLVVVSTYGDGEPPDTAKALHGSLGQVNGEAPLKEVRFSVCALGDTNYTQFCQCGKDFDALLEKAGATRVAPRAECDLEYEQAFTTWLDSALKALESGAAASTAASAAAPAAPAEAAPTADSGYSKSRPFPSLIIASQCLSGPGAGKQVQHVEFSLEGSGLTYAAGDALGVFAHNCPELVADVLTALGCDGEEAVPAPDGSTTSLRRALTEHYDLGKPPAALLTALGTNGSRSPLHVIDALLQRPVAKPAPADFVGCLRKLPPRLYSISSSPDAHPGAVHLTVGTVRYEKDGRPRKGVCSTFLAERVDPGSTRVGVFVHSNKAFRPPADGATPLIMVGPGTGIAPFRAFLEHRRATGASGKNWLFFGDQHEASDFLYREEILAFQSDGLLTRLDLAWSRDQAEKVYVQNRLLEQATEIWSWLEAGAHFCVCGDASRMAKDVDAALHKVIEQAGGRSTDQAAEYVQALKAAKRYVRDVY